MTKKTNNQGIQISGGTINAGNMAVGDNAQIQNTRQEESAYDESEEFIQPVKVLFLAANPMETESLRVDREIRSIDQALRNAQFRDVFELEQQWAVQIADLQSHLLRYQPDIVHFSGHSSQDSEIILEDANGNARPVPQPALAALFSVLRDNIRCVVLNACFSYNQAMAIAQHIDCVVGMSNAVGDDAAIAFAASFYQALGYGRSVQTAFELGKVQIGLDGLGEEDTPQLILNRGGGDLLLFNRDSMNPR